MSMIHFNTRPMSPNIKIEKNLSNNNNVQLNSLDNQSTTIKNNLIGNTTASITTNNNNTTNNVASNSTYSNITTNGNMMSPISRKEHLTNQRLDLGTMIEELTSILGKDNWINYAQLISRFILGKLSRRELIHEIDELFNKPERQRLTRLHNKLLLGILTNSLRDSPLGNLDNNWGFQNNITNMTSKRVNKHNSQIESYKKIVMSLPINDRNRLKTITRDSGKRGFIYCSVLQNRLHNIPKIPIVTNNDTLKRVKSNNLKTPLEWSQDIVNGFNAPLATDNYSLPDTDTLYLKMIGIAREHGLVGSVDTRCVEMVSMALDNYLKSIVEFGIDTLRYRTKKYSDFYDLNEESIYVPVSDMNINNQNFTNTTNNLQKDKSTNATYNKNNDNTSSSFHANETTIETDNDNNNDKNDNNKISHSKVFITNEDIYNTFTIFPNLVESTSGTYHNITANALYNDDDLVVIKSTIDDLPEFNGERPLSAPIDERNIGTREELNWLIKDILTEE